jgi:hypothetical protein
VSDEHLVVTIVETDTAEKVHQFLSDSRLNQWNTVRVVPALTVQEGMKEIQEGTALF